MSESIVLLLVFENLSTEMEKEVFHNGGVAYTATDMPCYSVT